MIESIASRLNNEPATLSFELGGRRFSPLVAGKRLADVTQVRRISEPDDVQLIRAQLTEVLWERLNWNQLPAVLDDRQQLIRTYIDSLNQIHAFRQDVEQLVQAACRASIEFRLESGMALEEVQNKAVTDKLQEMIREASFDWPTPENVIDAGLVAQNTGELRGKLHTSLRDSTREFTAGFFELLAQLVDRQLMGLVEWYPNHCCAYHFFVRVLVPEERGTNEYVEETVAETIERLGVFRAGGMRRIVLSLHGLLTHRLARHEHTVINVIHTSIGNSQVVMPLAVTEMLKAVPEWLYPFVKVVDGEIVRERIIERDLRVEEWEVATSVRDEPLYGPDPAVLIGSYVLVGWGPREIEAELKRRESTEKEALLKSASEVSVSLAPVFLIAALVLVPISLVFYFKGLIFAAFIAGATAVAAAGEGLLGLFRSQRPG